MHIALCTGAYHAQLVTCKLSVRLNPLTKQQIFAIQLLDSHVTFCFPVLLVLVYSHHQYQRRTIMHTRSSRLNCFMQIYIVLVPATGFILYAQPHRPTDGKSMLRNELEHTMCNQFGLYDCVCVCESLHIPCCHVLFAADSCLYTFNGIQANKINSILSIVISCWLL